MEAFRSRNTFSVLLKSLEKYSCGARELRNFLRANLTWPLDIIAWPVYRGVVKFLWQSQRPTESETGSRLRLAASGLSLGLQLCSWIAMWEQQSFHGISLTCKSLNRWPATPTKPVSVVHRSESPSVQLTGEAATQFSIAAKKMCQPASYLIRLSSSRPCWKHLLLRDTLVLNIRYETTEWQMFIVHQRWHCALGQEPLSLHFGQLWTPAISMFLVSFSKTKHFHLVRYKLFPTMCLVWKSEEQQRFGGCSKSSTSGGRNLYARYRLA